jgi:uncharacterized protein YdaU (DUF1376 family)
MSKDPAFLFYPNDYIGGTMGMTFEEKGAYMELLMMQFNRGHMTTHMIGQTIGQLWVNIQDKFKQDENGLWFNERLDIEKNKRKNFTDSRKNNISGTNQHTKKPFKESGHMDGHMTSHMENENINDISNDNKESNTKNVDSSSIANLDSKIPPQITKISEYCKERNNGIDPEYFFDYYQVRGWKVGKDKMKDWKAAVRTWEKNNINSNKQDKVNNGINTNF